MEKSGSSNKFLVDIIETNNDNHDSLFKSDKADMLRASSVELLKHLKTIGLSGDIKEIINCERLLIDNDLARLSDGSIDKGTKTSLENASRDLDRAYDMTDTVMNKEQYKLYDKMISLQDRDRVGTLPRDAFHSFIKSNCTRLSNGIISPKVEFYDKQTLKARHENMNVALKEYSKLQAIALDIKLPEKSKEHER